MATMAVDVNDNNKSAHGEYWSPDSRYVKVYILFAVHPLSFSRSHHARPKTNYYIIYDALAPSPEVHISFLNKHLIRRAYDFFIGKILLTGAHPKRRWQPSESSLLNFSRRSYSNEPAILKPPVAC